jgi:hypothetical protein
MVSEMPTSFSHIQFATVDADQVGELVDHLQID